MLYVTVAAAFSFLAGSAPAVHQRTADSVVNMVAVRLQHPHTGRPCLKR